MATLGWEEGGGGWRWRRRLFAWEEDSVRECVNLLNNIILQVNSQDNWCWLLDPIHGYSVSGTYRFLTSFEDQDVVATNTDVWHKLVPTKVSLFAWRLLKDRIPTRSNLARRHVIQASDTLCVGGCGLIETAEHLVLGCELFWKVWYLLYHWIGISYVLPDSVTDHYFQFTHLVGMPRASYFYLKVIWLACVWAIWKERNNCLFKNTVIDPYNIVEKVKLDSFLWLSSNSVSLAFGFHDWWRHPLLCIGAA
ncbi:uncharacterized protein [Medicago truncatula]|uniref:uncharacterized protein n=1 Tax=Medicago truncatula TaxID=3880 RepID=UPI000D2F3BE9|nr:uncharacterized protein LOC112422132 [Medicago truncatula]